MTKYVDESGKNVFVYWNYQQKSLGTKSHRRWLWHDIASNVVQIDAALQLATRTYSTFVVLVVVEWNANFASGYILIENKKMVIRKRKWLLLEEVTEMHQ
jgi:hypothetical protein